MIAEPSASVLTCQALSVELPPAFVAQTQAPDASIFATKISSLPALVRLVDPNTTVPSNCPVTIAEPSTNVLTP